MCILIFIYYLLFLRSANSSDDYITIAEYNFYKEMNVFQDFMFNKIKKDLAKCKSDIIEVMKNLSSFNLLYMEFNKNNDEKAMELNFRKRFPTLNFAKNAEIGCMNIQIFFQKYNNTFYKLENTLNGLCLWLYKDYEHSINTIKSELKNLLGTKKIQRLNYKNLINNINTDFLFLPIYLSEFERLMLKRKTKIESYKQINPIHELMPISKETENNYNYIDLVFEELQIYDLPDFLLELIKEIKIKNSSIIEYVSTLTKKSLKFERFINHFNANDSLEDYESKAEELEKEVFEFDSTLTEESLSLKVADLHSAFKDIFFNIQNAFVTFSNAYQKIKDDTKTRLPVNFADYKKYLTKKAFVNNNKFAFITTWFATMNNKNTDMTSIVKEKSEKLQNTLYLFIGKCYAEYKKYDDCLRKEIYNLIKIIKNFDTNINLLEYQKIKINDEKNDNYNRILKNDFISFSKITFSNQDFESYFDERVTIDNILTKIKSKDNTMMITSKILVNPINSPCFERKQKLFSEILALFTDNNIKKEYLCELLKFIEPVTENTEIKSIYSNVKHIRHNLNFEDVLAEYNTEKNEFVIRIKTWALNEIKKIDPSFVESPLTAKTKSPSSKNELSEFSDSKNRKIKIIACILIPVILLIVLFLIYKFKIKK